MHRDQTLPHYSKARIEQLKQSLSVNRRESR
ncbi:hypothetical protein ACJGE4_01450 [Bacillus velezensis]